MVDVVELVMEVFVSCHFLMCVLFVCVYFNCFNCFIDYLNCLLIIGVSVLLGCVCVCEIYFVNFIMLICMNV
jgi:hypothetical protein